MVEELKLAVKVDDDIVEQSLLKQFNNAEKLADKVVFTFKNVNLDNKEIEKQFKDMQKLAGKNPIELPIDTDKSLKMLQALGDEFTNIISIAKGLDGIKIDFGTKNKTEAYNQLKQMADAFKNFYGNKEAMHTKAGTDAAYAYYKAYEEAIKKGVAQSKLERVTVDVDKNDGFFNANRISSNRIEEFSNFEKYGGELTDLSIEISSLEERLLKFSSAYSQVKSNLGDAPITPDIIRNIEEYVHNLEIAEARTKDADLMGFNKEDIDIYKDSADMYLGYAMEDAIKENEKYQSSLKETQNVAEQVSSTINKIGVDKSNISSPIKDVFQDDLKASADYSAPAIKEESKAMEQVAENAEKASNAKSKFAESNKKVKQSADASVSAVNEEKISISSMKAEIDKYNKNYKNLNIKPTNENRSVKYQSALDDYKKSIDNLQSFYNTLDSSSPITSEQISKWKELTKNVDTASDALKSFSAAEKGSTESARWKEIDKITKYLDKNTRISKEAKQQLQEYLALLKSGSPVNIEEIHMKFNQIAAAERLAGREGNRFLDVIKDKAWYGWAAQMASMFSFYDIINGFKQCITTVRELDTALTEMRKVSDESIQSLKNYQDLSFDVADEIGSTALALQNATATWMRLGESLSEASESAKDATILMNVSEFESIDEATDSLVSMSQAFKELDKMEIIDVLDKIGNEYSISTDNLSRALQDSAAVLKTQGNDLYESVALLTAGNAINQDYSKTAGGVRTISLRLAGTEKAKEELSELGEDVDDFIVQTNSKTQELIKDYTTVASNAYKGIDVLDANGNLRNTYNILLDISKIYKEIQEEDKKAGTNRAQALVEYIAGKNRSNIASSILLNPELLESVYESAKNADGAAMKELDAYMESLDAKVAQFQNRLQELESDLVNSDFLKGSIDFGTEFIHILDEIINKFGALPTIMTGVGAGLGIRNHGKTYECTVFKLNCFEYALYT